MTGMNRSTGRAIESDDAHIAQSIADILTTRIGTRIMRRPYGSLVPALIDQPANGATRLRVMAAAIMAITRWEPRVRVSRIGLSVAMAGRGVFDLDGTRTSGRRAGTGINLSVPIA